MNWQFSYTVDILTYQAVLVKGVCDKPAEWITLAEAPLQLDPAQWHNVQLNLIGNRVEVILDGEPVIDYVDADSPLLSGRFALVTNDGTEALFDNVLVTEIIPAEATRCGAGETELFFDDFESGDLSQWYFQDENGAATGPWSVATDGSNHMLVDSDHNWALMGGQWQNYTFTLRLKRLSPVNAAVHINSHMSEGNRYYLIFPEGALRQDTPAVSAAQLGKGSVADDTEWHTLALSAADGRLEIRLDGESLGTFDGEALPPGGIGIENIAGSLWYDDVLVCGAAGGALYLDGAGGYASVPFDDSLRLTQALTIEAWVNVESRAAETCTDGAGYCNFMPVIAQSNPSSSIGNYLLAVELGKPLFGFEPTSIGDVLLYGDAAIDSGWHHLAAVHTFGKSAETRLYLDGQPVPGTWAEGDRADEAAYTLAQSDYLIGYMTVGAEAYFAGLLDELRVWNVARTQAEIQSAMNGELTGSEPGLVGYWKFDEPPGAATARDSSPNGNDASLEGSAEIRASDAPVAP